MTNLCDTGHRRRSTDNPNSPTSGEWNLYDPDGTLLCSGATADECFQQIGADDIDPVAELVKDGYRCVRGPLPTRLDAGWATERLSDARLNYLTECVPPGGYDRQDVMPMARELIARRQAEPPGATQPVDFDAWLANPYTKVLQESIKNDYVPRTAQPPAPDGMVLVPVEPTDHMLVEGCCKGFGRADKTLCTMMKNAYRAMLAARK